MKLKITWIAILMAMCIIVNSQQQYPTCDEASFDLFCSLDDLNGYPATMFDDIQGVPPTPLCQTPNGGGAHNLSWFGFIAGSTTLEIELTTTNCTEEPCNAPSGICQGIQFGIYTDCSYSTNAYCQPNCTDEESGTYPFTITNLTVGDDYYMFLDGCAGSVCDYVIRILSGGDETQVPEFLDLGTGILCDDAPCDEICAGSEDLTFSIDNFDLSIEYNWSISPPLPNFSSFTFSGVSSIQLDFPVANVYELCVDAANFCDTNFETCKTLTVIEIQDETFLPIDVCENEYPALVEPSGQDPNGDSGLSYGSSGWQGNDITQSGVTTVTASNSYGCEWEQSVTANDLLLSPPEEITRFFCDGTSIEVGGIQFNIDEFEYEFQSLIDGVNGCDSTIILTAYPISVETVVVGACLPDGTIDLTFNLVVEPTNIFDLGGTATWYWERNNVFVLGSDNALTWNTNQSGNWHVVYEIEVDGVVCDNFSDPGQDVETQDFTPAVAIVDFPEVLCPENLSNINYSLDVIGYVGNESDFTINWTIPADVVLTGGDITTPNVELDFTNSIGGDVCYEVVNICGSTNVCNPVSIASTDIPMIDITGVACPDGTFTVQAMGVDPSFQTIVWDFDGANAPNFVGNENTVGPFTLDWPGEIDDKTVSVSVTYATGCQSYSNMETIEFTIDPIFGAITCIPDQDSLVFIWNDVPGATSYNIIAQNIITGGVSSVNFDPDNNQIIVNGLSQGDTAEFTIEAVGPNGLYCTQIIGASSLCETIVCPDDISIALINPFQDTVCLGQSVTTAAFSENITNGQATATGTYSSGSPGIASDGNVDATAAGVGTHYITYQYALDNGCRQLAFDSIIVTQLPTFTMGVMDLVVCKGDTTMIMFEGDYDGTIIPTLQTNGATIVSATDTEVLVFWDTPGTKNITSEIYAAGCGVIPQAATVEVEELPLLSVTCSPQTTSSSIEISWNADIGFDNYDITIGNTSVNTNSNTHMIDGLQPLTEVFFTVEGFSNNACKNVIDTITCISVDCPAVTLEANYDDLILCVDATTQVLNIQGTYDASLLSGSETLTIIVDGVISADGMFDPITATEGNHLIELELEDDNCKFNDNFTVNIERVPNLVLNSPDKICITDTWQVDYTGDINGNYTYDWMLSDARTFTGAVNQAIDFDIPGNYTLTLDALTANCNANETIAMVEVFDSLITPNLSCQVDVDSIVFSWIDQLGGCDQYFQILVNGMVVANQDDAGYVVNNLPPETDVTIEVTNESLDCICPAKSNILTCRTDACPAVTYQIDQAGETICRKLLGTQPLLNLSVSSATNLDDYTIEFVGDGVTGNTFNPAGLSDGTITIEAMVSKGMCPYPMSTTITLITIPEASFDYEPIVCIEDELTLTYIGDALGDFNFAWNGNGLIIDNEQSPTISFNAPGMFDFDFVTGNTDCGMETFPLSVTVLDSLRTPTVDCNAGLDNITIDFAAVQTDCEGDLSVLLDGVAYTGDITTGSIDLTDLDAGTDYTIEVINTSECGCSDKSTTIACSTDPCPDLNFQDLCDAGLDNINVSWNLDIPDCGGRVDVLLDGVLYTGDISSNQIPLIDLQANTLVEVEINYISDCGCDDLFTFQCMTDPCPVIDFLVDGPTDLICVDGSQITSQLSASIDGVDETTNVQWSGPGVDSQGLITLAPDAIQLGSQTYTATIAFAGCTYSEEYLVDFVEVLDIQVELDIPCPGTDQAMFTIINADSSDDVVFSLNGSPLSQVSNVPVSNGDYVVEALVSGECASTAAFSFVEQEAITLEMIGDTLEFAGVVNEYSVTSNYALDSVVWTVNGETHLGNPAMFAFFSAGELCVTAYISEDCPTTICKDVQVDVERVFTPNIFRPDGQEPNNTFSIFSNVEIASLVDLAVYDRWGNQVFHVSDVLPTDTAAKWDGTNNGEPLQQGVYIYTGVVEFLSGEELRFTGDITLFR